MPSTLEHQRQLPEARARAPTDSSRSSAGVPCAITWPQWITEMRSARPNRNAHVVLDDDDRQLRLQLASIKLGEPRACPRAHARRSARRETAAAARRRARRRSPSARRSPYERSLRRHVLLAREADVGEHCAARRCDAESRRTSRQPSKRASARSAAARPSRCRAPL